MSKPTIQVKIEIKNVKHTFTPEERQAQGQDLARSVGDLRGIHAEFDQVKANYKAKITEKEAKIDSISTSLVGGFEMRNKRCLVAFRPDKREKDFFLVDDNNKLIEPAVAVLTEPMTREDFQQELIDAESLFEKRKEIDLFIPTDTDRGVMVLGRFQNKWYSALRIQVGKHKIEERLDSEQKAFKVRGDAVHRAGKRAMEWLKDNLKDNAKGFEEPIAKVIAAQIELAE